MVSNYWHKQQHTEPLFSDLLWSKPENKMHAGKLLIIGGNLHGFSAPASAYSESEKAGIGSLRVLMPDAIQKTVGRFMPEADFGPSTPSGSFASRSLDAWFEQASWADAVLLAGDLGRNSETAILIESFVSKYDGQITLTKDAADYIIATPLTLLDRPATTLVLSFAQLQKLAKNARSVTAFTFNMDLLRLVDALHEFTMQHKTYIVTKHLGTMIVAVNGQVSTTKIDQDVDVWRVITAAKATVWWLQHPNKPFEALTTALVA
jgi:NAD(P)H-hydrate repair Nnr-like enzyme with NAD(P)H-hydrate dehydratase domain